jgi:hypothetical protein
MAVSHSIASGSRQIEQAGGAEESTDYRRPRRPTAEKHFAGGLERRFPGAEEVRCTTEGAGGFAVRGFAAGPFDLTLKGRRHIATTAAAAASVPLDPECS